MVYDRYMVKAKQINSGKWVTGYYYKMAETTYCTIGDAPPIPVHHYILQETMTDWELPNRMLRYEVDPDTLCQCTEFKDAYNKTIWENDLIKLTCSDKEYLCQIVRDDDGYGFMTIDEKRDCHGNLGYLSYIGEIEVIGNKFDEEEQL